MRARPSPGIRIFGAYVSDATQASGLNESDYIDRIVDVLQQNGVTVHLHAFDKPEGGLYRSETREVFVNVCDARQALLTLAHEAGHWAGYAVVGERRNEAKQQFQRERQAYVFGWKVLRLVGADALISRSDWIDDCQRAHLYFTADEAGLLTH